MGKEVDSIIRDLADMAMKMMREQEVEKVKYRAGEAAEERILDILLPAPRKETPVNEWLSSGDDEPAKPVREDSVTRQKFRKKLREGELDDKEIELDVSVGGASVEIMTPPGMEEMASQLQGMFQNLNQSKKRKRKMKIKDALKVLTEEEAHKMVNEEELKQRALFAVEQTGIVFLDEIDKVARSGQTSGADVSREGVQRDLLPLIEGCTVNTKYGMVKTDHILFIASGAFHLSKPSDLIPELQGRFPIRVELDSLSVQDFEAILTQTHASLTKQYQALLATEGVTLEFTPEGITRLAHTAFTVNERTENIGARRLSTVMERLLDEVSFDAVKHQGQTIVIDAAYVDARLEQLSKDEDLSRYIL